MKIGRLNFKDFAAQKPVMLSETGKFLNAKEVAKKSKMTVFSLHTLSDDKQIYLALKRYETEPDFKLGIFNLGTYTKAEVLKNIKEQTEFGKLAVRVEMQYCNELINSLKLRTIPRFPRIPQKRIPRIPEWRVFRRCFWFKLKATALFAENTTDSVTTSFANYRIANVHPVFQARGFNVVVNQGTNNTRTNFVATAKKPLTVYLSGIGHGNYNRYTGHGGENILKIGEYEASEVKNKAIHFLSCRTAAQLGPDTITEGAYCYAGYDENFTFVWDNPSTPVNEVDLFKICDSTFDIHMANGSTAQQAFNATVSAFNAAIAMVPGTTTASWLTYDRDHLKLHGNSTTKIRPYRYIKFCLPFKSLAQEEKLAEIGDLID